MQPYEIRQLRNGSIDYNNYFARPVSLLTPNMRRFSRKAASPKIWLFMAATVAALALIPVLAGGRGGGKVGADATTNIQVGAEIAASPFLLPAGPRSDAAQILRGRIEMLDDADPRRWWDGYGKTTARGQSVAIAELKQQLRARRIVVATR